MEPYHSVLSFNGSFNYYIKTINADKPPGSQNPLKNLRTLNYRGILPKKGFHLMCISNYVEMLQIDFLKYCFTISDTYLISLYTTYLRYKIWALLRILKMSKGNEVWTGSECFFVAIKWMLIIHMCIIDFKGQSLF